MFLRALLIASLILCAACTQQDADRPSASATQPVVDTITPSTPSPAVVEEPAAMTAPVAPERKTKPFDNTDLIIGTVKVLTELQPLLQNPATRLDDEEDGASQTK